MTVLLLLAVVVLVLLNGFFVAAEFALVRVRRSRMEEEAEEGRRGARLVVRQLDELSRYLAACQLGHHLHLAGHRLPRRAGGRRHLRVHPRRSAAARRHAGHLARPRLPDHDLAAHHDRRAGAEDLRDQPRRDGGAPDRAAAAPVRAGLQPVHPRAQRDLERDPACGRHPQDRRVRRGRLARGAQGADRAVDDRRQARRRRGADADRRLPPARAAGAAGDDAGAGGGHRRSVRERRDRAPALRRRPATRGSWSPRTRTTTA